MRCFFTFAAGSRRDVHNVRRYQRHIGFNAEVETGRTGIVDNLEEQGVVTGVKLHLKLLLVCRCIALDVFGENLRVVYPDFQRIAAADMQQCLLPRGRIDVPMEIGSTVFAHDVVMHLRVNPMRLLCPLQGFAAKGELIACFDRFCLRFVNLIKGEIAMRRGERADRMPIP